ncbi:hypothetical protein CAP50_09680 [Psychrobacter sp. L7]|uniref:restriction endonuclease subunit S n=1 Tax=Psychrobacter sp. L7 TaxID=1982756 RepID=UPI000C2984B0|nr:restriction endonuclease subunit S [Psychrobacter sp. L7]PJX22644.1 hypothetical protein CAP50_09680 [Psychrobacter sp. L7]
MTDIWQEGIFDNLVRLKRGYDLPNQNIVEGVYPVVASSSIKAYHNQSKVKPPIVVTGRSGTLGKVQYINEPCWPLNTTLYSKDFRSNCPQYVYYFLEQMNLENYNAGAGVPTLNQNHLQKLKIKIPPLTVQKKLAAVLTTYDDLIDVNKKRIAILENIAEELYKEWFVRFRFPNWQNTEFKKGVPSDWTFSELNEIVEIIKGKSYTSEEIHDEKVEDSSYFINLKSFHKYGGYRDSGLKYYTGRYSEAQKVSQGNIVMAVTDMTQDRAIVGRVARIPTLNNEFAIISLDTVKIISKIYSENFMYCYFSYSSFSETVKEFANGANVLHLSPKQVLKQIVLLPPVELTESFDTIISPILDKVEALTEINAQLELIKQQLLPRLISGKLSVAELDIHYPPSMQTINEAEEK